MTCTRAVQLTTNLRSTACLGSACTRASTAQGPLPSLSVRPAPAQPWPAPRPPPTQIWGVVGERHGRARARVGGGEGRAHEAAARRVGAAVAAVSCGWGRERGREGGAGADMGGRERRSNLRRFNSHRCKIELIYGGRTEAVVDLNLFITIDRGEISFNLRR
jgi:hypothetical protein